MKKEYGAYFYSISVNGALFDGIEAVVNVWTWMVDGQFLTVWSNASHVSDKKARLYVEENESAMLFLDLIAFNDRLRMRFVSNGVFHSSRVEKT